MPVPKQRMTAQDYWDLPSDRRAELIDGELWDLAAPSRAHQYIQGELVRLIGTHIKEHKGACQVYPAPFSVNLFGDESTIVEPDISVICDRSKLSDRGCEGAPDLIIEIACPSNRAMDYRTKLSLYTMAGVREYLIIDPTTSRTMASRTEGDPAPTFYPFALPVPVEVLPGLELDVATIVAEV